MSVKFTLHVLDGATVSDLRIQKSSTMESKYFDPKRALRRTSPAEIEASKRAFATPHIHVAECSWIAGDVPETVRAINDFIGENLPIIDDSLIGKVREAYNQPTPSNPTITPISEVSAFCEAHRGKRVYIINW